LESYTRVGSGRRLLPSLRWLPLEYTPELSELLGYLFGDGSLERSYRQGPVRPKGVDFISDCDVVRNRVAELFAFCFLAAPHLRVFRATKGLRLRDAAVARALWVLGLPIGAKVYQPSDVPLWIKKSPSEFKRRFIRAYFDCDASTPFKITRSKASFAIRLTVNKLERHIPAGIGFLNSIKSLLYDFGVECNGPYIRHSKKYINMYGEITVMLELLIQRQASFLAYGKEIGFTVPAKQQKLNNFLDIIVKSWAITP